MADQVQDKTQELVILAKGGDESALEQLCGVYAERVRRIVRLRMGSEPVSYTHLTLPTN